MNLYLQDKIEKLDFNSEFIALLHDKGINVVDDLWKLSRKDLKKMHFTDEQIKLISIKMQLWGMDIDRKFYD